MTGGDDEGLDLDSFWLNPLFNLVNGGARQAPDAAGAEEGGGSDGSESAQQAAAAAATGLGGCSASAPASDAGVVEPAQPPILSENPLFKEPKGEESVGCRRFGTGGQQQRAMSMGGDAARSSSLPSFWGSGECTCGVRETGVNQRLALLDLRQARQVALELELVGRQMQLDARESETQEHHTMLLTQDLELQGRLTQLAVSEAEAEERQRLLGEAAAQQQARFMAQALELSECRRLLEEGSRQLGVRSLQLAEAEAEAERQRLLGEAALQQQARLMEEASRRQELQLEVDLGKLSAQASLYFEQQQRGQVEWAIEQERQKQEEWEVQLEQRQQQAEWAMLLEADLGRLSAQASARMLEGDRRQAELAAERAAFDELMGQQQAELAAERALFDELRGQKQAEWEMQLQEGLAAQVSPALLPSISPCQG